MGEEIEIVGSMTAEELRADSIRRAGERAGRRIKKAGQFTVKQYAAQMEITLRMARDDLNRLVAGGFLGTDKVYDPDTARMSCVWWEIGTEEEE